MPDTKQFIISQSIKFIPFFVAVIIYFIFVREPLGELWTTVLKCAPIVCLMLYILLNGLRFTKEYKYSLLILLGLIFSCGGDVLLNINLFAPGMACFGVAQICYIFAFGFKPLMWSLMVPLYLLGAAAVAIVFKDLEGVLPIALPIYVFLLLTMCWRGLARAVFIRSLFFILCAVCSVCFVISDGFILLNMFLIQLPYSRILIMSTYYLAQFGITLSTSNKNAPISFMGRNKSN